ARSMKFSLAMKSARNSGARTRSAPTSSKQRIRYEGPGSRTKSHDARRSSTVTPRPTKGGPRNEQSTRLVASQIADCGPDGARLARRGHRGLHAHREGRGRGEASEGPGGRVSSRRPAQARVRVHPDVSGNLPARRHSLAG